MKTLAESKCIINAFSDKGTTSQDLKQTARIEAPAKHQTGQRYATQLTTDATPIDVGGTESQIQHPFLSGRDYRRVIPP